MGAFRAEPSARVLGRYVLHGELASGGMATVHLARLRGEAGFARTVAIKRLHAQFAKDPEFVAMFVDEARLAARIRHPNVVPTLDVVSEDGEIFLVMEYVHGQSLSRILRTLQERKQLVSPAIATTVMAQVLHGLHAAHEARSEKGEALEIVHRDVSPQNVLVGLDGMAHVLDFGVAKATGRVQTTREGQLKGKISYMAPEQLDGGTLTRQSDVYAAAVVLWETLTLRRLFDGDNEAAILVKVIEGKIPRPSQIASGISPELDAIVLKGLERDRSKRWQTARELAVALERCVPLAPGSIVGEWVQDTAGEELARRARKLAEIERGSVRLVAAADISAPGASLEIAPGESESGIRIGEPKSQVSTISVSKSEYGEVVAPRRRSGRGWFVAAGIAAIVIGSFVLGVLRGTPSPAPPRAAAASGAEAVVGPSPSPAAPNGASTPGPASAAAQPPGSAASAAATPSSDPTPANTGTASIAVDSLPRAAPPAAPPRATRVPRPRSECDPPFTRDTQGHKHYKLQCL